MDDQNLYKMSMKNNEQLEKQEKVQQFNAYQQETADNQEFLNSKKEELENVQQHIAQIREDLAYQAEALDIKEKEMFGKLSDKSLAEQWSREKEHPSRGVMYHDRELCVQMEDRFFGEKAECEKHKQEMDAIISQELEKEEVLRKEIADIEENITQTKELGDGQSTGESEPSDLEKLQQKMQESYQDHKGSESFKSVLDQLNLVMELEKKGTDQVAMKGQMEVLRARAEQYLTSHRGFRWSSMWSNKATDRIDWISQIKENAEDYLYAINNQSSKEDIDQGIYFFTAREIYSVQKSIRRDPEFAEDIRKMKTLTKEKDKTELADAADHFLNGISDFIQKNVPKARMGHEARLKQDMANAYSYKKLIMNHAAKTDDAEKIIREYGAAYEEYMAKASKDYTRYNDLEVNNLLFKGLYDRIAEKNRMLASMNEYQVVESRKEKLFRENDLQDKKYMNKILEQLSVMTKMSIVDLRKEMDRYESGQSGEQYVKKIDELMKRQNLEGKSEEEIRKIRFGVEIEAAKKELDLQKKS